MGPLPTGDPLKKFTRGDDGQLLMLAGIVLTIAFILTALTLAQVASLEKAAANEQATPIVQEWRFLHDRLGTNLRTAITPDTTIQAFQDSILPTIAASFRTLAAEKGYDLVLRAAGGGDYKYTGTEADLITSATCASAPAVASPCYDKTTTDGKYHLKVATTNDANSADGVIWQKPCPDPTAPAAGCISGVYAYMRLADPTSSMEESVLVATNQ